MESRVRRLLPLVVGLTLAVLWFSVLMKIGLVDRLRGDASGYLRIATRINDWGEAFRYVGERSVGFPLTVFALKQLYSGVSADKTVLGIVNFASYVFFVFHVGASLGSYFLLRRFAASLGTRLHAAYAMVLLAYPGLVAHTTVLLADTYCADLALLGFAVALGLRDLQPWLRRLGAVFGGILIGFAVLCRPSYEPAVLAALVFGLGVAIASARRSRSWQPVQSAVLLTLGVAACIIPAESHCAARFGVRCLLAPQNHDAALLDSLRRGTSSVRVYWTGFVTPEESDPTCGGGCRTLRDETLAATWAVSCQPSRGAFFYGLPGCFLHRPDLGVLFLFKKTLALFDSYHFQDYAVDQTPRWARLWTRPFGALAYSGFALALGLLVACARDVRRAELAPFIAFSVLAGLVHSLTHIEPRYGYGAVPGALFALFWFLGTRSDKPRRDRYLRYGAAGLAILFLLQTSAWDRADEVMQRIEANLSESAPAE